MLAPLLNRLLRRRWRHARAARRVPALLAWIALMVALHVVAMMVIEDMPLGDALWLTAVTATTVGYGDVAAKTDFGRAATFLFVLVGLVFAAAKLASDWFDWRETVNLRKRTGAWDWKMHDHLLIAGTPAGPSPGDPARFFAGIAREFRANPRWDDAPIALLTRAFDGRTDGLPQALCDLGVVHVSGDPTDADALARAGAARARAVIILALREDDAVSDAVALDVVARVREAAAGCRAPFLVAECLDERNRPRLRAAGCDAAVRPLRAFPEMLARAVLAPGSVEMLEDLFTVRGDELHRVDLSHPWRGRWGDLVARVLDSGTGTAIGYVGADGAVVKNPAGAATVDAAAIFVIVHESQGDVASRLADICRHARPA